MATRKKVRVATKKKRKTRTSSAFAESEDRIVAYLDRIAQRLGQFIAWLETPRPADPVRVWVTVDYIALSRQDQHLDSLGLRTVPVAEDGQVHRAYWMRPGDQLDVSERNNLSSRRALRVTSNAEIIGVRFGDVYVTEPNTVAYQIVCSHPWPIGVDLFVELRLPKPGEQPG